MNAQPAHLPRPGNRTGVAPEKEAEHIFTIRPDSTISTDLTAPQGVTGLPGSNHEIGLTQLATMNFDGSRFWPAWEALAKIPDSTEAGAVAEIEPLLVEATAPEVRAALMRALRLSEPAQFKIDAVRAKTLEALAPYASGDNELSVFVQELELHPANKLSTQVAVNRINSIKLITNPELGERILGVILAGEGNEIVQTLRPNLKPILKSEFISKTCEDVKALYEQGTATVYAGLKVLALSGDKAAQNLLCRIARQEMYGRWGSDGFFAPLAGAIGGVIFGVLAGLMVSPESAGVATFMPNVWIGARIGLGLGIIVGMFAQGELPRISREKIKNFGMAIRAAEALGLCKSSESAEKTLLKLVFDPTQDENLRKTAATSITNFQSDTTTSRLRQGLKEGEDPLKLLCLVALSKTATREVIQDVTEATQDPNPQVMTEAYKSLDFIGRTGR